MGTYYNALFPEGECEKTEENASELLVSASGGGGD